ncbi:placenta-specific protein 9 [Varanus komodoensis]|uniref:placenta-specific protein 9 n=1 Tax=Varanus komodoensis TaxID=61221 RepID=UPI001CF7E92C|nr:placenta-specific protein 9 [Varanus komodoensis]
MPSIWPLLFLLMWSGQGLEAATDPEVGPQGSLEQDEWCDDHSAIHRRLDAIQERMEKTVDSLDSEVTSLLNTVSETAWSVPLPPGSPQVDLLEDTS